MHLAVTNRSPESKFPRGVAARRGKSLAGSVKRTRRRRLTVRQDVDGLIVDIEEAAEALTDGHERPIAGEDMRIKLEMPRHVAPSSQQQDLGRRVLLRRLSGGPVMHPLFVVVVWTLPRSARRRRRPAVGVLAHRRTQHRLRMARPLVGSERRRATANAGNQPPRKKRIRRGAANEVRGRPPRAERTSSQRRRRRHCIAVASSRVARRSSPSAVTAAAAAPSPWSTAAAVIRARFGLSDGPVATATASISITPRSNGRSQPHHAISQRVAEARARGDFNN